MAKYLTRKFIRVGVYFYNGLACQTLSKTCNIKNAVIWVTPDVLKAMADKISQKPCWFSQLQLSKELQSMEDL